MSDKNVKIGLALSGGGSRAIAFHLGCMRALHELGVLSKVDVLSTVSGGSVIGAMYAYSDCSFEEFEERVKKLLSAGLTVGILRYTFFSRETPKIIGTILISGLFALLGGIIGLGVGLTGLFGLRIPLLTKFSVLIHAPFRRFGSRTTAFAKFLKVTYFDGQVLENVSRKDLQVVINAAELRTQSAFRFGSQETRCWRFGVLKNSSSVAKAVAASAAFPGFLPALDEKHLFLKNGLTKAHRVLITDGGVYDNLGTSCLLPGRDPNYGANVQPVDIIIACVAGHGLTDGKRSPYYWPSRMSSTLSTIHQRTHTLSFDQLHRLQKSGKIKGFVMPYLGQQDEKLPSKPNGFVQRSETFNYPTDFSSMSEEDIQRLSIRGEQLTRVLMKAYQPNL